jgi:hypothetical protein
MKSKDCRIEIMAKKSREQSYALCIENKECEDSAGLSGYPASHFRIGYNKYRRELLDF